MVLDVGGEQADPPIGPDVFSVDGGGANGAAVPLLGEPVGASRRSVHARFGGVAAHYHQCDAPPARVTHSGVGPTTALYASRRLGAANGWAVPVAAAGRSEHPFRVRHVVFPPCRSEDP